MFAVQYSLIRFCTFNVHNNLTVIRLKKVQGITLHVMETIMKYFLGLSGKFLYFFKATQCFSMKVCTYIFAIVLTVAKGKKSV